MYGGVFRLWAVAFERGKPCVMRDARESVSGVVFAASALGGMFQVDVG